MAFSGHVTFLFYHLQPVSIWVWTTSGFGVIEADQNWDPRPDRWHGNQLKWWFIPPTELFYFQHKMNFEKACLGFLNLLKWNISQNSFGCFVYFSSTNQRPNISKGRLADARGIVARGPYIMGLLWVITIYTSTIHQELKTFASILFPSCHLFQTRIFLDWNRCIQRDS